MIFAAIIVRVYRALERLDTECSMKSWRRSVRSLCGVTCSSRSII
jgi:hypothetical protein